MSADRQAHEISEPNEWDFKYYGWRVVLAACLGVMAVWLAGNHAKHQKQTGTERATSQ
jgi:hypothetical protein